MNSKKEVNINGICINNTRFYDNLRPECETISVNSIPDEHQDDIILALKNLCVQYSNKIIMQYLDINFKVNKFKVLSSPIGSKIDILMTSETKLDVIFPTNQFFIQGHSTVYRLHQNDKGGGVMLVLIFRYLNLIRRFTE